MWLFEPHILSYSCVPSPTRKEREMCGSKSRTFLSACPILLCSMRQHRERKIRRTLCSLPLARSLSRIPSPIQQEREMCGSSSRAFSPSRIPSPTTQERNVRFFEPHISLCLSRTISNKPGERTENMCIREFTFHINVIAIK